MKKIFNTTGACDPHRHYMVDIQERLAEIKKMVDAGEYFTINRARQYGKTTTLQALAEYMKNDYAVISLDFQMMGNEEFSDAAVFSRGFVRYLLRTVRNRYSPVDGLPEALLEEMGNAVKNDKGFALGQLFSYLSDLCGKAKKPVVLIIDEVDSATNNQVFLDFLAQIRAYYLARRTMPTFQSVILASVYDVKNIKRKICLDEEHKINSPWNIAADFDVIMSLSQAGIEKMLKNYEQDHHTGMDTAEIAGLVYRYTSGYPFLVSRLCQLMDRRASVGRCHDEKAVWTKGGFLNAVTLLLMEKNTLFESLMGKLQDYPGLMQKLHMILFGGERVVFNPFDPDIDLAVIFGLAKVECGMVAVANRIFETLLYDYFLTVGEAQREEIFRCGSRDKTEFIKNGRLDMAFVLQKFVEHFGSIYGDRPEEFDEEEGRRRFLLYLRPIINGTGNYYIEAQTRDSRRMDIVVDYGGEQFVVELKIWRGNAYHERGEGQLSDYLDYFGLKKGYMLSYNFNQKKESGVKEILVGGHILIEAVV